MMLSVLACIVFVWAVVLWLRVGDPWQKWYRVGSPPDWLQCDQAVDWLRAPKCVQTAVEPSVSLVAAFLSLHDEICNMFSGLHLALTDVPSHVRTAALVYYGHTLLGQKVTVVRAFRLACLVHFVPGFADAPDDVAERFARRHAELFCMQASEKTARFLSRAHLLFDVDLKARQAVLPGS